MGINNIFRSKHIIATVAYSMIQQIIVASSTWILAKVVDQGSQINDRHIFWLFMLLVSLSLPYIPSVLASLSLMRIKQDAVKKAVDLYSAAVYGKTTSLNDAKIKGEKFTFMSRECEDVISNTVDCGFDFFQTSLNVTLNIMAIVGVISPWFLVAYAASILFLVAVSLVGRYKITSRTRQAREDRLNLDSHMIKSWDNLVIGNLSNVNRWRRSYDQYWATSFESRIALASAREWTNTLGTLAAILPVAIVTIYLAMRSESTAATALLVAALPRQLMILNHLYVVGSYGNLWHEIRERLAGLSQALNPIAVHGKSVTSRIKTDKIRLYDEKNVLALSWDDLWEITKQRTHGRLVLRGENGSGKSTLLRLLKERIGEPALYLPAEQLNLAFAVAQDLSSGQRAMAILQDIASFATPPKLILLDEWDANMDEVFRGQASSIIDQLAEKSLVIEVSHRSSLNL